jgi:hypothetical protein
VALKWMVCKYYNKFNASMWEPVNSVDEQIASMTVFAGSCTRASGSTFYMINLVLLLLLYVNWTEGPLVCNSNLN